MSLRSWVLAVFAFTLAWTLTPARAAGAAAQVEPRDAHAWLTRIHQAATRNSFTGLYVVSAGGMVTSSRISHYCEGREQYERIETLDGQMRRVLRHNDLVATVWPHSRVAQIEHRDSMTTTFPSLLHGSDDGVTERYEVRMLGTDRVAGYEAQQLELRPRDDKRYGYRLWAEKATGLLLRAEVLGERDEVLEAAAFSEITIGVPAQPEQVLGPMKKLEGYRVVRPAPQPTRLESEGWVSKSEVPGFRLVNSVKRPLDATSTAEGGSAQVLQVTWSDGLSSVSAFIEPYAPQRHAKELSTSIGATQTLIRRHNEWWITVMGDVPAATLRKFASGLQRRP